MKINTEWNGIGCETIIQQNSARKGVKETKVQSVYKRDKTMKQKKKHIATERKHGEIFCE